MSIKTKIAAVAALAMLMTAGHAIADDLATSYKTGLEGLKLKEVKTRAEAGDATAQLELGHRYYYDKHLKDDKQALAWFQKAAAQNLPWAEYETAVMIENGEGTTPDPVTALQWYQKAAAVGVILADFDIGVSLLMGETGPADPAAAAPYLKLAAEAGEPRAEYLLGTMYRDGKGVTQDPAEAVRWFRESVKRRFQPAAETLEVMYREGTGVEKDAVTSHAWRIMSQYLQNYDQMQAGVPAGATAQYYYLVTPKLSQDDNLKAWEMYAGFMREFGFVDDKDDGKAADAVRGAIARSPNTKP